MDNWFKFSIWVVWNMVPNIISWCNISNQFLSYNRPTLCVYNLTSFRPTIWLHFSCCNEINLKHLNSLNPQKLHLLMCLYVLPLHFRFSDEREVVCSWMRGRKQCGKCIKGRDLFLSLLNEGWSLSGSWGTCRQKR